MEEVFRNPEINIEELPDFETVTLHPVSVKLRTKSLVQTSLLFLIIFTAGGIFLFLNGPDILVYIILSALFIFFSLRFADIILKQKYYGYALREKDIIFRQGYITTQTTVVPFNRIQHSAINRSLFDKVFGIASLEIYTAGGSGSDVNIPGLSPERAGELNSVVSEKISKDD
ncbi:MAG TPA: PH domain-containing protein [Flavobacteriaceae bacterium]|nr:PH domain-containing protein [Flavobacteriaceae bacterium]